MKISRMQAVAAICMVSWQSFRGIAEGMVMYMPAVREHPWFGMYHVVRIAEMVGISATSIVAYALYNHLNTINRILWIAGLSILAWEAFELSYMVARCGQAASHENVLGLFVVNGMWVYVLHVARAVIGSVVLIIGGKQ